MTTQTKLPPVIVSALLDCAEWHRNAADRLRFSVGTTNSEDESSIIAWAEQHRRWEKNILEAVQTNAEWGDRCSKLSDLDNTQT